MKVLVAGGAGQLGLSFGKLAPHDGLELVLMDSATLNIVDPHAVDRALESVRPDVVINAAAYTAVDKAEADIERAEQVNCIGPFNLAVSCHRRSIPLLQVSTDYVFDGSGSRPYLPGDSTHPLGVYGQTKWRGEQAVRENCQRHLIVRTAWVFSEFANNFLKTMLRVGAERESLNVVSDQHGGPTYAPHLAAALLRMAEQVMRPGFSWWGTYHFSGEPETTWHGFADEIFREAVASGVLPRAPRVNAIPTSAYPTPAKRPLYSVLDCTATVEVFGPLERNWQRGVTDALHALANG